MRHGLCLQAFAGAFQRCHAPVGHLVEEDVERRLVELDDVHARGFQLLGLLVQNGGELPCQLFTAAVVGVVQGVHHGHRAGQSPLDLAVGQGAQELRILHEHRGLALHRADHAGHAGLIAVADQHRLLVLEVNA